MVQNHIIEAPEWANYLGDFMEELPINCLFNKGVTGCGGTELALRNDKNTIIAMPFVPLVINKVEKEEHRDNVLGVYSGISDEEIEEYICTHDIWKIAVVYDSLPRVIRVFEKMGIGVHNKCFLLVDEYHIMFNQYSFRNEPIIKLLEIASNFTEKTYMTATPLCEEFMIEELKDIPVFEVIWPNKRVVTVIQQPTSSPLRYVVDLVKDKLNDKIFGNCHFFVNSVQFIASVLQKTNINPDDVKIVCANRVENERKLKGYQIGKPSDPPCKINFYTSTCFEGCDILDEQGKTYVVSTGKNPNTLYDISTLFVQIIGRIRDSVYKDNVVHIFSNSGYNGDVPYLDFKSIVEREYRISQAAVDEYNAQNKCLRKECVLRLGKEHFMNRFIRVNEEYEFILDLNLLKKNLLDYKLKSGVYNNSFSLLGAYRENGLKARCSAWKGYSDKLKANSTSKTKFKDVMEEYNNLVITQNFGKNTERLAIIKLKYPFISDAYHNLGIERVRELGYNITLIKRELVKISDKPLAKKIIELIVGRIGYQNPVELQVAKNCLQEVYEILDIRRRATASKLNDYFITHESQKTIGGRLVNCIELIKEKTILPE